MQTVLNIIITILVFGVLILAHEAGHFFTALWAGVKVNEFAIGMGPAIFKKQGKKALYTIRALPIGGFVQMDGEDGDSDDENAFNKKPKWKRFIILITGALMNILFGFILICIVYSTMNLLPTTVIGSFDENAVSNTTGLLENDKIVKINDYNIYSYMDISYAMTKDGTVPLEVTVERDGQKVVVPNVEFATIEDKNLGEIYTTDFSVYGEKRNLFSVIRYSFQSTISISRSIYSFLGTLVTGHADINQVSGPIGTTSAIGQSASIGLRPLLLIVALISINLGIVNLLPFPALDGGRVLLLIIEAIRKKPLSQKVEVGINAAGLILLMGLMVVIAVKDVIYLF